MAEILRVPSLSKEQWLQACLPVKLAGLGVGQTKLIARCAYVGSCALTKDLVAALLKKDPTDFVPTGVSELLNDHEEVTDKNHDQRLDEASLSSTTSVR